MQLRPWRWRLLPVPHAEAGLLHRSGLQRGRSRILQGAAQGAGPGLRARRCREPAVPGRILRRGGQCRSLNIYPHFDRFLARSSGAASRRALPHVDSATATTRGLMRGTWQTQACGRSRTGSSTTRYSQPEQELGSFRNEIVDDRLPAFLRKFGREFAVVDGYLVLQRPRTWRNRLPRIPSHEGLILRPRACGHRPATGRNHYCPCCFAVATERWAPRCRRSEPLVAKPGVDSFGNGIPSRARASCCVPCRGRTLLGCRRHGQWPGSLRGCVHHLLRRRAPATV